MGRKAGGGGSNKHRHHVSKRDRNPSRYAARLAARGLTRSMVMMPDLETLRRWQKDAAKSRDAINAVDGPGPGAIWPYSYRGQGERRGRLGAPGGSLAREPRDLPGQLR